MTFRSALLISLVAAAPLAAQRTSPAITIADLRSRLFRIADDSMLGRETGSHGDFETAAYVAAEFARLGLKPAGEQGYFQAVPFWVNGSAVRTLTPEGGPALHAGSDFVVIPRATSASLDGVTAVYGGALADPASWIDASVAAGKLVVFDGAPGIPAVRLTAAVNSALANQRFGRARGVAVAQLDLIPASVAADFARARTVADSGLGTRPIALIISARAESELLGSAARTVGTVGRTVHADAGMTMTATAYPARNVIGVLPGRDPALRSEYVSLSAHNDHVGICRSAVGHDSLRAHNRVMRVLGIDTPDREPTQDEAARIGQLRDSLARLRPERADSVCNGADDDGSGTVALLEMAEWFAALPAAQRPRRSLLFISHVGEERGLVGSKWFTDHATVPIDSIVAEIDEDMIGRGVDTDLPKGGPTYLEVVGARRLSNEFGDLLEAANVAQPQPFVFNYEFDVPGHPLQYYCRADHYSYARYGIPSVAFSRGEHLDYHQVTDEAQYIDYPDMLRVVDMVRDAAVRIANLDHAPRLDKPKGDPHARCVQ